MKPKRNYKTSTKEPAALDLCQTMPAALGPIMKFFKRLVMQAKNKRLWFWDPGCGAGILANAMRVAGFRVIESDILLGQDFFEYEPPRWDIIVTNPPYGIKPAWLKRCYELQKPFALLMPTEFQATGAAVELFEQYGISIMNLTPRVDFKMPVQGWFSNAQFPVSWYTHGSILPKELMFGRIRKPPRTISRQVLKKNKKTGEEKLVTEWGYDDWVEKPTRYDWDRTRFIYEEEN